MEDLYVESCVSPSLFRISSIQSILSVKITFLEKKNVFFHIKCY